MTRETKAGLVVCCSFICLVAIVLFAKMRGSNRAPGEEEAEATAPADPVPAELNPQPAALVKTVKGAQETGARGLTGDNIRAPLDNAAVTGSANAPKQLGKNQPFDALPDLSLPGTRTIVDPLKNDPAQTSKNTVVPVTTPQLSPTPLLNAATPNIHTPQSMATQTVPGAVATLPAATGAPPVPLTKETNIVPGSLFTAQPATTKPPIQVGIVPPLSTRNDMTKDATPKLEDKPLFRAMNNMPNVQIPAYVPTTVTPPVTDKATAATVPSDRDSGQRLRQPNFLTSPGTNNLTNPPANTQDRAATAVPLPETIPANRLPVQTDPVPPTMNRRDTTMLPPLAATPIDDSKGKDIGLGTPSVTVPHANQATPNAATVPSLANERGVTSAPTERPVFVPIRQAPAPVIVPVVAPGSEAANNAGQVESYDEETYVCRANDTFRTISLAYFQTDKYERALMLFNRNHPLATEAVRQEPPLLREGQGVYVPPKRILDKWLLPDEASAKVYRVQPGGERLYEIARRTLGNAERWQEIYRLNPRFDPKDPVPAGSELRLPPDARLEGR